MICARGPGAAVLALLLVAACGSDTASPTSSSAPSGSAAKASAAVSSTAAAPASASATPKTSAAPDDSAVKTKLDAALPKLRKLAEDPAVVSAIKAQNAKKVPLEQIKKLDDEWKKATGVTPAMKPYLENPAADALKKHAGEMPAIAEAFAMDDQGALVATVSKTSDFWQGDEDKWTKSFASGAGADFIDKPSFDESSQTYSVQVSIPVMDEGKAIGAVTVGLSLDKL